MGLDATNDIIVQVFEHGDALTVTVHGDAGAHQAERLDSALLQIKPTRPTDVTLDLAAVTFISSLGLAAVMTFRTRIQSAGGRFRIGPVSLPVLSVLKRVRLTDVLELSQEQTRGRI